LQPEGTRGQVETAEKIIKPLQDSCSIWPIYKETGSNRAVFSNTIDVNHDVIKNFQNNKLLPTNMKLK